MRKTLTYLFIFFTIFCNKVYSQKIDFAQTSMYVYNFIKYSEWPDKKTTINVGIIGSTQIEPELKALIAKKKGGTITLNITNIKSSDCKTVDVIIVSASSAAEIKIIQPLIETSPILVITESKDQNRFGACFSFFIDEDDEFKTKYQLSTRNCKTKGINVSEQILNNAVLVR